GHTSNRTSQRPSSQATLQEYFFHESLEVLAGSETEQRRIALFFGEGGSYEIEDLRARAAMLDLLESDINLMSQDLERLMEEILLQSSL
ncbi:MAG TPA: hypothetical protein VIW47_01110, partial [Nitrospiraceae bacterium]